MFSSNHLFQDHPFPFRVYSLPLPLVPLGSTISLFLRSKDVYSVKLYFRSTPTSSSILSFSPSCFSARPLCALRPPPGSVTSGCGWVRSPFSPPVPSSPANLIPCSLPRRPMVHLGKVAHAWGQESERGVRLPKKMKNVSGRVDLKKKCFNAEYQQMQSLKSHIHKTPLSAFQTHCLYVLQVLFGTQVKPSHLKDHQQFHFFKLFYFPKGFQMIPL